MNARTEIIPPTPSAHPDDGPDPQPFTPHRHHGWTPDKQRTFLEAVSEGHSIAHACRIVGLTKQSAYAFRNRAQGGAFAIGWQAAVMIGRNALADELMDRVLHGTTETVTYRSGETLTRHRHDNRLAMAMLTRMDRAADAARGEAGHAAARLVAAEFDQFLDMVGRDGGPARAGLFLGARAEEATPDDLAPIRALARADKWLRAHGGEADVADLDPAARAGWTAEQWARAEAAGLVVLAPHAARARARRLARWQWSTWSTRLRRRRSRPRLVVRRARRMAHQLSPARGFRGRGGRRLWRL
ncbi:MAG: hypothetical protein V4574_12745 [Pseudomonadota bacterium]